MAYDIYGNNLRRGYCEVHPQVNEEYPCSLCYAESDKHRRHQDDERRNYKAQDAFYDLKELTESQSKEIADLRADLYDFCLVISESPLKDTEWFQKMRAKYLNGASLIKNRSRLIRHHIQTAIHHSRKKLNKNT